MSEVTTVNPLRCEQLYTQDTSCTVCDKCPSDTWTGWEHHCQYVYWTL